MTSAKKQTVLITGAAKRVGRDLALLFAKDGHDIVLHYNSSKDDAKNTAKDIEAYNVNCTLVQADLTDHSQVTKLLDNVPTPDILINSASAFEKASFSETTEELLDLHMDIHFKAPFFLSQQFAKKAKKGHIINIADTYVTRNTGAYFAYLLSKKILVEFTRMAALDLAPHIRINAIALGLTEHNNNINPEYIADRMNRLPIAAEININELYQTMQYLLNIPSVTGECIFLDNGNHLL